MRLIKRGNKTASAATFQKHTTSIPPISDAYPSWNKTSI